MAREEKKESGSMEKSAPAPAPVSRWLSPFEEIDRLFDDFLSSRAIGRPSFLSRMIEPGAIESRAPRVDLIDRETELVVRAELPGVDKKDLDISLNENVLTIKGQSRFEETHEEKGDYYRREIAQTAFSRTIPLPSYVDSDKAQASFRDGILELTLPKVEHSRRRRIQIQ